MSPRTREQAEAFARRHAIPRVFTDYRAFVDSPDVDVVDICAMTDRHHGIAIAAAQAGKHVILTNAVIQANINPNNTLTVYAPDGAVWGDEYITEKVETKAGWQFPSPEEDWMRGDPQELEDFVAAAATGRRVELPRP
jgi:hypothetical protein